MLINSEIRQFAITLETGRVNNEKGNKCVCPFGAVNIPPLGSGGLFFLLLLSSSLHAQVTIGSEKKPSAGVLLMLDDGTTGSNNENAKRGLGLPRVELQAYDRLKMGATATEYTEKDAHIGLVVYDIDKDCDTDVPTTGLHVWDGGRWVGSMPHHLMCLYLPM